jgi:peptide chain release factor 1
MLDRLAEVERRYDELTHLMAQPEVATNPEQLAKYAREQMDLEPLVSTYRQYRTVERQLAEAQALLDEESDEAMRRLARDEVETLKDRREQLAEAIKRLLLPKDPNDERNVIVEIRAAAGGDEAGLFAADLFRMYSRYAQSKNWAVDVIDANQSGIGGFKEIIFEIKGRGAYSRLK